MLTVAAAMPTRRALVRRSAATAGAVLASAGWAGCASTPVGGSSAAPAPAAPATLLVASIPFQGSGNYSGVMQQLMDAFIEQNWTSKHPGVGVKTMAGAGANGSALSAAQDVTDSIAGAQVPDTLCGCCGDIQTYVSAQALAPLDSYIKQDNVDLSDFSPGHLQGLQSGGQQMALPQYDGPEVLVYSQDLLDQMGLAYPDPTWTYQAAQQLWQSIAATSQGKRVYGAALDTGDPEWLVNGFGGAVGDSTGTRCTLDSPQCVQAYRWLAGMLSSKTAMDGGPDAIKSKSAAFAVCGGWDIQYTAISYAGMKWDYLPMPVFPAGKPSTFINNDFNAINAYSKNPPDLVWDLFKFITLDPDMQHFQFKTTFITPNRKSLWQDWIQIVRAVAPPLQNKHLEYFQAAVDYGWPTYFFKYAAQQANNVEGAWITKVKGGQVDAQAGLQQCAQVINALEAAGAAETPRADLAKLFPTQGPEIGVLPTGI
jgi:multiple sugar transport system substrate-binding protein